MSDFTQLGEQIGKLVSEKQEAYGDSYGKSGKVLEALYPDGVRVDQYPTFLAVTRVIDKLFRVATKKDAFGESPWRDIAGYALLGIAADERGSEVPRQERVYDCLLDYAREYKIPIGVPAPDGFIDPSKVESNTVGFPDIDPMGMRIIRNVDPHGCRSHPETGICGKHDAPVEFLEFETEPSKPRYEFIEEEDPIGSPSRPPLAGKEVRV